MSHVHVMDHPLIQHKVSLMRDKETGPKEFRELLNEISMLMAYEVTRDLPLKTVQIETPICRAQTKVIAGKKLAIVPILRAGLGKDRAYRPVPRSQHARAGGVLLQAACRCAGA